MLLHITYMQVIYYLPDIHGSFFFQSNNNILIRNIRRIEAYDKDLENVHSWLPIKFITGK